MRYVTVRFNAALLRFDLWRLWVWLTRRRMCRVCRGHGRVLRLDSGYMLRFGLRYWDGCKFCGGDRETPGTGLQHKGNQ